MTPENQGLLFLSIVLVGASIGFFYDIFRILRKVVPHGYIAVQIEDILFWLVTTVATFYFILTRNFGEVRPFVLIAVACGMIIYFYTLSPIIRKVTVVVINFVVKVVRAVFGVITAPLRFIYKLVAPFIKIFLKKRHKNLRTVARYGKMQVRRTRQSIKILHKKV